MTKTTIAALAVALLAAPDAWAASERRAPQAPPVVLAQDDRVRETLDLPTWRLQQVRRRMLRGERISFDDMRTLADLGDGLASWRYANRLMALENPDLHSAAALYYATAAYTGRDYAVRPLVELLERRDVEISDARLRHLENALRSWALRGNTVARDALIDFYATGHPFGRHPDRARALRRDLAREGDVEAALAIVIEAMSGGDAEPGDPQLLALLDTVAASGDLGMRATALNLRALLDAPRAAAAAADTTSEREIGR
jgi:hypothetical protein